MNYMPREIRSLAIRAMKERDDRALATMLSLVHEPYMAGLSN